MMEVRIVRMAVRHLLMHMLVNVRLRGVDAGRMFVLVVLIMDMPVQVNEPLVGMFVGMPFCQHNPEA